MKPVLDESFTALFTDPGSVHTGYVIIRLNPRDFEILEAGEVSGLEASAALVIRAAGGPLSVSLWVYEGFRLYAHKADAKTWNEFEEVQTIGAMRLAASAYRESLHITKQYASEIKIPPFTDARLRSAGLDIRGIMPSNHTRDAFRHFLCYWCFKLGRGFPVINDRKGSITVATVY